MSKIDFKDIEQFSEEFNSDRGNVIAANASVQKGILESAVDYKAARLLPDTFSINLEQGSITNQKSSGRCWLFSALNTFRYELIHNFNLADAELSQNYLFFYDKLEKANYFLESCLKIVDEPVNGRLYSFLNSMPLNDGGQWDMLVNVVNKYGVCPLEAYPESANSVSSRGFTSYLTSLLREDAVKLRNAKLAGESDEALQDKKKAMMSEVYRILVIALGEPPKTFDWQVYDKDKKLIREFGITPKEFYDKYIGLDLNEYVSVINAPTSDKPFNQLYRVTFLGNVVEGREVVYLNLPIDVVKKAVIEQLKDGHPVWFGCDCGKFGDRKEGLWDKDTCGIEKFLNIHYEFSKADKLTYGESAMNHAMVFLGVNLDENGNPDRWRIENSWGGDAGRKGYYTCSDAWLDEYLYQVSVNKKYLPDYVNELLKGDIHDLQPWDPMGTLAD